MELYFILNVILSIAAIFVMHAKLLSYRQKLYSGLFALICWLLPIQMLSSLRSTNLFIPGISDLVPALYIPHFKYIEFFNISLFAWLFVIVTLIGCIKFIYNYQQHLKLVKLLKRTAVASQSEQLNGKTISICDTKIIKGAMTSGILSPIIWIGNSIQDGEQREAVILHELNHIKNRDPLALSVIHLVECLLWWNPLALVIAKIAKQHIELSCDEACKNELGIDNYRKHLAMLILSINDSNSSPMEARFSSTSNDFNIVRIKKLSEIPFITKGEYFKYAFISIGLFLLLLLFIRSGQTGLDGNRSNILLPTSPTTWDIRVEQMPIRSLGILGVLIGLEGGYIHREILYNFYYLEMKNATLDEIVQKFSEDTKATAKIINNILYISPDSLKNINDLSWITADDTAYFPPRPENERITWESIQLKQQKLKQ